MRIKRDDVVRVIAGNQKGKEGRVLRTFTQDNRIVVEGVNYVWKHIRRSQQHAQGGRLQKEAPLSISNVKIVCQACGSPTRVGIKAVTAEVNGRKKVRRYRVCRRKDCGKPISKSDEATAAKGDSVSLR